MAKLTAGAFGLSRVVAFRSRAILGTSPFTPDKAGFYWSPGIERDSWLGYRPDPLGRRTVGQISEIELANAMRDFCVAAHGMSEDELWSETLRLFGFKRRTQSALSVLQRALDTGRSTGRLAAEGEDLVMGC